MPKTKVHTSRGHRVIAALAALCLLAALLVALPTPVHAAIGGVTIALADGTEVAVDPDGGFSLDGGRIQLSTSGTEVTITSWSTPGTTLRVPGGCQINLYSTNTGLSLELAAGNYTFMYANPGAPPSAQVLDSLSFAGGTLSGEWPHFATGATITVLSGTTLTTNRQLEGFTGSIHIESGATLEVANTAGTVATGNVTLTGGGTLRHTPAAAGYFMLVGDISGFTGTLAADATGGVGTVTQLSYTGSQTYAGSFSGNGRLDVVAAAGDVLTLTGTSPDFTGRFNVMGSTVALTRGDVLPKGAVDAWEREGGHIMVSDGVALSVKGLGIGYKNILTLGAAPPPPPPRKTSPCNTVRKCACPACLRGTTRCCAPATRLR